MPDTEPDSRFHLRKLTGIVLMGIAGLLGLVFFYGFFYAGLGIISSAMIAGVGALAASRGLRIFNSAK